jgi:electron transfer flavoprotein alpha subunit
MLCIPECSFGAISKNGKIVAIDMSLCTSCGVCLHVCPYGAIDANIPAGNRGFDTNEYQGVWVVAECIKKRLCTSSLEIIGKARELADSVDQPLSVVLFSAEGNAAEQEIRSYPIDKLLLVPVDRDDTYDCRLYTTVISSLILTRKPAIVLISATDQGRELAPGIAARINTGLTADCTDLKIDSEGRLVQIRPAYGGNIMASIVTPYHRPQMATMRPGVFIKPNKRICNLEVEKIEIDIEKSRSRIAILSSEEQVTEYGDLENANFVVTGGAGMGCRENFHNLKEIAEQFDGAVGGTREAVDRGWIPKSHQIGQTGSSIGPDVYITCGVSGAIHHLVGIHRAKKIISVNTDPSAPIMKLSDVAIVGDVEDVLPKLIRICKQIGSS